MKYIYLYILFSIFLSSVQAEKSSIWDGFLMDNSNFNNSVKVADINKTLNKQQSFTETRQWVIRLEKKRGQEFSKYKEVFQKNKKQCKCRECFEKAKAKDSKLRYVDYLHQLHKNR